MIDPTATDIGRLVVYRDRSGHVVEQGVITSFNAACVFVWYGAHTGSQGTRREDLEWASDDTPSGPVAASPG